MQSSLAGPQRAARSQALINDRVRAVTQRAWLGTALHQIALPSRMSAECTSDSGLLQIHTVLMMASYEPVFDQHFDSPFTPVWPRATNSLCRFPFVTRLTACHNLF